MQKKRGQLTLFIILGIVIIFAISLIFILTKSNLQDSLFTSSSSKAQVSLIENDLKDCFEQRVLSAIWSAGLNVGYVESPRGDFKETSLGIIYYGLKDQKDQILSKEEIEKEIKAYIDSSIPFCLNIDDELEPKFEELDSLVSIKQDFVEVKLEIPFYLEELNSKTKSNQRYKTTVPIRLGKIVDLSHEIVKKQKESGDMIPITYLTTFDVDIIFDYYDDKTLIYIINDKESTINEISYSFAFLAELNSEGSK
jgi:hypothetical protein